MTQMRKGIAAQMTRALQAPHAYVQMEVDATRPRRAPASGPRTTYQAREGISLSYVPFVVKAAVEALKRNPTFNAHWTETGCSPSAASTSASPWRSTTACSCRSIRDVGHARDQRPQPGHRRRRRPRPRGKLRLDDFGGSTFTVDNTGYSARTCVMPIINVPEVGILTMEAITKRAVVRRTPDGDVIAIRPIMNMVLGVDHRANDGAGGAALLRDIKAWLEVGRAGHADLLIRSRASQRPGAPR